MQVSMRMSSEQLKLIGRLRGYCLGFDLSRGRMSHRVESDWSKGLMTLRRLYSDWSRGLMSQRLYSDWSIGLMTQRLDSDWSQSLRCHGMPVVVVVVVCFFLQQI